MSYYYIILGDLNMSWKSENALFGRVAAVFLISVLSDLSLQHILYTTGMCTLPSDMRLLESVALTSLRTKVSR